MKAVLSIIHVLSKDLVIRTIPNGFLLYKLNLNKKEYKYIFLICYTWLFDIA